MTLKWIERLVEKKKMKNEKKKIKINKKKVWRYVVSIFCIFGALTYHMLVY